MTKAFTLLCCAGLLGCGAAATSTPAQQAAPLYAGHAHDGAALVDPEVAGAVTLPQLLAFAEAHAPSLRVAASEADRGDAEVRGADALIEHNPELAVSAGGRTIAGVTRFEIEASIEQRIEIGGERGRRIEAAERMRDAHRAELDVARWELHALVHALFYKLRVREEQLAAVGKIESFTKSVRAIIDRRVEAGEDPPLETVVAKAELAKASQIVIAARQAHQATALRLAEIVGWPIDVPLKVKADLRQPGTLPDRAALTQAALDSHPSKRWLMLEVRAAEARVDREAAEGWPEPAIGFSYGREAEAGATAHVWLATVRVPIPLFERNQAGRAKAGADLEVARAKESAFEPQLRARIAAAVARVDAAAARANLYGSDILPAFEGNLNKLERAFELGEIDVLQLAQIQQRILVTQSDALTALEDYFDALAALEALSGVDVLSGGTGG